MRTYNSYRNTIYALGLSLATILIGLVAQKVFISALGTEYLGINGLFTSIVSMLALVELGLGSAIYYHLYKPVARREIEKIKSLIDLYKNGYRVIAVIVFMLGLSIAPFLSRITGEVNIAENLHIIYFLFLADIVFSYLLTYKRSMLYVDQKSHIISTVHLAYLIILNAMQITALIITGSFYLYLGIKIVMRLAENIALTVITNRKYPFLRDGEIKPLDRGIKSAIYKKIRGLFYHKIGSYVVLGTDNVLISVFLGVSVVGLYSNYLLVTTALIMIANQAFTAVTSSVGNLLVDNKHKKRFEVFERMNFANFWLSCFAATSLLVVMDSFVSLWIGSQYLLPIGVLVAISFNLYLTLIRSTINSFKEAGGVFHEDRFVPIIEAVINLGLSILFLKLFGLIGVFIGTACSTLILHLFSYPKFVYKPMFNQSYPRYYTMLAKNTIVAVIIAGVTFAISRSFQFENSVVELLKNILISVTIPNLLLLALFYKSEEFGYFKDLGVKGFRSITKKLT